MLRTPLKQPKIYLLVENLLWGLMLDKKKLDVDEYIELVFSIGVADTEEALKKLERLKRYLPPADYEKIRANLLLERFMDGYSPN